MADLIDIEFGDQRLRVPAWATEATLEAVMKYNEITARALNKLVGVSSDGKKTFRVQEHYFKEIVTELQKSKKKQEELVKQNNTIIKDSKTKTSTSRAKDQSASNTATSFDKKMSELSKNYSTSITLVEGSLLYLSKSLIDLNLVVKEISDTYKTMLRGSRRISKVFNTSENNDGSGATRTSPRQTQRDSEIFRRERRDLSFKSLFTSFVEDLIEKQEKSLPLEFTNEEYMKGVNDLKKAIKAGNTKGLLDQYIKVLNEAVTQVSEGKTPTEQTIKQLDNALKDFSIFNQKFTGFWERVGRYYGLLEDTSISPTEKANKESYDRFKKFVATQEKLANAATQAINGITSLAGNAMTTGITFNKLTDLISKVAGTIPILGGIAAGITAVGGAVLEEYINGLKTLSGISVGLGSTLLEMNGMAASAGMNLESFSKLLSENASSVKALGTSTQDGAMQFVKLSETLRAGAKQYNQFGLTNSEYNEILLQEIELRRKSGMDSSNIYNSVSNSMNDLLYNTNQLAALTGQNTREMRRNMQNVMSDSVVTSIFGRLSAQSNEAGNNLQSLTQILGKAGASGNQFSQQIIRSLGTGMDLYVGMNDEMRNAMTLSDEMGFGFRDVFEFVRDNYATMPTEEFQSKLIEMVSTVDSPDLRRRLEVLGQAGRSGATVLLDMINNFEGMNDAFATNQQISQETGNALENSPWLAIPSELENLSVEIKNSILADVINTLGIDTNDAGDSFVTALRDLTSKIKKDGVFGTTTDMITSSPTAMITTAVVGILGALGIKNAMTSMVSPVIRGGRYLMNSAITPGAAGVSNAARNMMSFAGTGAIATTAATTATAGTTNLAGTTAANSSIAGAAQGGSKLVSFLKWLPIVGDVAMGVSEGMETGSVGRGLFGGVGSFLGRLGMAAAGTATTGVGGVITQAAGSYGGANIGSGLYDWLFGEDATQIPQSENITSGSSGIDYLKIIAEKTTSSSYFLAEILTQTTTTSVLLKDTMAVHANTTNTWLQNLNGVAETIRDDISEIKTNGGIQNNDDLIDLLSSSSQNTQTMVMLMSETNALLQRLIRRYDEIANN